MDLEKMLGDAGTEGVEKERAAQILKALEGLSIHAALELLEGCKSVLMRGEIHYR